MHDVEEDLERTWNPPDRSPRERRLDRVKVAGAVLIGLLLVAAAVAWLAL